MGWFDFLLPKKKESSTEELIKKGKVIEEWHNVETKLNEYSDGKDCWEKINNLRNADDKLKKKIHNVRKQRNDVIHKNQTPDDNFPEECQKIHSEIIQTEGSVWDKTKTALEKLLKG